MTITSRVTSIPLFQISDSDRLRQVDPDFVAMIAASMDQHGLMQPVEVGPPDEQSVHRLISGAHRVAAARLLQWTHIEGRIFNGDQVAAELREIDENLFRHELSDLDRATFLAKRKALWLVMHPETGRGKKSGKKENNDNGHFGRFARTFSAEAAEKVGLSERTVRRLIARHDALHPDVRRRLSGTRFAWLGSDLDALAALPHAQQLQALDLIEARGITRVAAALDVMRGPRPSGDDDEAEFLRFTRRWEGFGPALRARVHAFTVAEMSKKRKGEAA